MAAGKKGVSIKVRLESSAGTGYRYYTRRPTKGELGKLGMKKFDPWAENPEPQKRHARSFRRKENATIEKELTKKGTRRCPFLSSPACVKGQRPL